ncbi:MAG: hypothetical protein M1814_005911 [Vezdaea aestivalis]|nr:MAG: hypothetical protein M1814_005911 [Vezdaea aestivalis]
MASNPICREYSWKFNFQTVQPQDCPRRQFITRSAIEAILKPPDQGLEILKQLYCCPCSDCLNHSGGRDEGSRRADWALRDLQQRLSSTFLTLFALLISLRCPGLVRYFLQRHLSLRPSLGADQIASVLGDCPTTCVHPDEIRYCATAIHRDQFKFDAINLIFSIQSFSTTIPAEEVLPIQDDDQHLGNGGFGKVYAFRILSGHAGDRESDNPDKADRYARKIFNAADAGQTEWDNLVKIHQIVGQAGRQHNIMPTLGAYQYGMQYFIVFPLAKMSLEFYLTHQTNALPSSLLWRQVSELARGLAFIQGQLSNPSLQGLTNSDVVYHLDIKPSNILIYKSRLMLADFGLSTVRRFHQARIQESGEDINPPNNHWAPPEAITGLYRDPAAYDIWSLGAILSEVATHDVSPDDPATNFEGVRNYRGHRWAENQADLPGYWFYQLPASARPAPSRAVARQHLRLGIVAQSRHLQPSQDSQWRSYFYTPDFFSLVDRLLSINPTDRGSAAVLHGKLQTLIERADRRMRPTRQTIPYDIYDDVRLGNLQRRYENYTITQDSEYL